MTWEECLERLRTQDEYLASHPDNITLSMAEQIEANRKAINELYAALQALERRAKLYRGKGGA